MTLLSQALDSDNESTAQLTRTLCSTLFKSFYREEHSSLFTLSGTLAELYAAHESSESPEWEAAFSQLQHDYNRIPKTASLIPVLRPLYSKVTRFREYLIKTFSQDLNQYLSFKHQLDKGQLTEGDDGKDGVDSIEVQELLVFWDLELLYNMFTHMPDFQYPQLLDNLYTLVVESSNQRLNQVSLQILCEAASRPLEEDFMAKIWTAVCTLTADPSNKVYSEGGYRLWLRWISVPNLFLDMLYQEILGDELYWTRLNSAIVGASHQCRKYALHILTRSLKSINRDISVPSFQWTMAEREFELGEWNRYVALIEIVAIDTSFNQTQESLLDFKRILKPSSPVPSLWAISLLTVGLRSSSENIRKVIAGVVMDLEMQELSIMTFHSEFATSTVYKYLMNASHFVTIKNPNSSYNCPHGQRLAQFTCNFVQCAKATDRLDDVVTAVLQLMFEMRSTFDPARFFVFKGLAQGLVSSKSYLSEAHLDSMKYLGGASSHAETELREHGIIFYCLQILTRFDLANIDLAAWVDVVALFSQRVSYKIDTQLDRLCVGLQGQISRFEAARTSIKPDTIVAYVELLSHLKQYSAEKFVKSLSLDETCFIILAPHQDRAVHNMATLDDFENQFRYFVTQDATQLERPLVTRALLKKVFEYQWITDLVIDHPSAEPSLVKSAQVNSMDVVQTIAFLESDSWIKYDSVSKIVALTAAYRKLSLTLKCNPSGGKTALTNGAREVPAKDYFSAAFIQMIGKQFSAVAQEGRMSMAHLFSELVDSASTEQLKHSSAELASCIWEMWEALVTDRLMANERALHKLMVSTLLHKRLVWLDEPHVNKVMADISNQLVVQCYARRGILPVLANHLSLFEGKLWVGEAMVLIYTFLQQDSHLFRMEYVIANILDSELGSCKLDLCYFHFYGDEEVAARIVAADYLFNFAGTCAPHLIDHICSSKSYRTFDILKRNDAYEEMVRVRCFQAMLLLEREISNESFIHQLLFTHLMPALQTEPSPLARIYIEWLVSRILVRRPEWLSQCVFETLNDCNLEPRLLAANLRIGLMVSRRLRKRSLLGTYPIERAIECCETYLEAAVALSTSNRSQVRHTAVSMICAVVNTIAKDEEFRHKLASTSSIANRIAKNAVSTESYRQYKSGEQTVWDIEDDMNLLMICGGVLRKVSERLVSIIHLSDFIRYLPGKDLSGLTSTSESLASVDQTTKTQVPPAEELSLPVTLDFPSSSSPDRQANIQTKSGAWKEVVESPMEGGSRQDESSLKRGDLIVQASLVDKAPNLGGICRVCEVLGAKTLCIPDMSVIDDSVFKTVAVTSDQWMPMDEVKPQDIKEYMRAKRREGYTLIGLEQTDNSLQLDGNFHFPEKTVLLLGKEREGVPADLLAELDLCVEIPQVGIIRSMNIQTAAAVAIHAYSVEHCA